MTQILALVLFSEKVRHDQFRNDTSCVVGFVNTQSTDNLSHHVRFFNKSLPACVGAEKEKRASLWSADSEWGLKINT